MTPAYARYPWQFGLRAWWQILRRWFVQVNADNVSVAAAGVAFFSLLAIFPLLSAGLSLFAFFSDPAQVRGLIEEGVALMPAESRQIVYDQIDAVVGAEPEALGLGFLVGLTLALYSAGAGIRAMMRALNIAYGEVERRPFWQFYLTAFAFTVATGVFFALAFLAVFIVPAALNFIPYMDATARLLAQVLPFVAIVAVFFGACFVLYRYGPDRRPAKKRWLWPGAIFATVLWLLISWGFSRFVSDFSSYNATYGSIASVVILLMWLFLTAFVVIMGAELNAEMERQTLIDTTTGPDKPIGVRGANMADFLPEPLTAEDIDVPVAGHPVRPRHIRGTDMPPEKVEGEVEAEAVEAPKGDVLEPEAS